MLKYRRITIMGVVIMLTGVSVLLAEGVTKKAPAGVEYKDEVITFFPANPDNGHIVRDQIGDLDLWASGIRKDGKTRQIRLSNKVGGRGSKKKTIVQFKYPFGDASATWNLDVTREGDICSVKMSWNQVLIGEIMDVNEGADAADRVREKLGLTEPDSKLPVLFSSGDSISRGYWPFLEAALFEEVNVYHQIELSKDMPDAGGGNGHADKAYAMLQNAYKNEAFKPDFWLVNFGLHMIDKYRGNIPGYGEWVEKFIIMAKEKKAQLIFVNTTPCQKNTKAKQNAVTIQFNQIMDEVSKKHGVSVVDMYGYIKKLAENREVKIYTDGVHYTEEVKKLQAEYIAKCVRGIIGE